MAVCQGPAFYLDTSDAIHLASARESRRRFRGCFEGDMRFLAFDHALLEAARAGGFDIPA